MKKNQHVVPHNGKWGVRGEGNKRITKSTETQTEANKIATKIAKNQKSEVLIHRPNGKIRDKNSYGNDPFPPKG
jgi:hypothetical protein